MKVIISTLGKDFNSNVSDIFARSPYFLVVEIEDKKVKKFEVIENLSINQMGGAGITTAQMVAEKNVEAVITGAVGPRALDVLKQFNIQIYKSTGSVKETIQKFIDGKLDKFQ